MDFTKREELRIQELCIQYDRLCKDLNMDDKDASNMLQRRICLLHEYNELKDTAATLLLHYAYRAGLTLQEAYEKFGVDPTA